MKPADLSRSVSRAMNVLGKASPLLSQAGYRLDSVSGNVSNGTSLTGAIFRQGDVTVSVHVSPGGWRWHIQTPTDVLDSGNHEGYRQGWARFTGAMRKAAIVANVVGKPVTKTVTP